MIGEPVRVGIAAAARCLALDQHAASVITALGRIDVPVVLLKGPGLARRLYADHPDRRRYSDVDLLVAPADFARAENVLAALGHHDASSDFPRDEWLWHERHWIHAGAGDLNVDLHRGFAGVGDPEAFWDLVAGRTEPLTVGGSAVRVPDAASCALLVGLHAGSPGVSHKPVTDLLAAVAQFPFPVWQDAARLARGADAERLFQEGLRRVPAGVRLADALDSDVRLAGWRRWAARHDLTRLARSVDAVRAVPGVRAKLRFARRRMFPTASFLRHRSDLGGRGRAGLVAAYLLRPFRLLVPAPTPPDHRDSRDDRLTPR